MCVNFGTVFRFKSSQKFLFSKQRPECPSSLNFSCLDFNCFAFSFMNRPLSCIRRNFRISSSLISKVVDDARTERPELQMVSLDMGVDVHISHAMVTARATFVNRSGGAQKWCMLEAPVAADASVTACSVNIGGRMLETMVCDPTGIAPRDHDFTNRCIDQACDRQPVSRQCDSGL